MIRVKSWLCCWLVLIVSGYCGTSWKWSFGWKSLRGGDAKLLMKTRELVIHKIGMHGIGTRHSPEEHFYTLPKGVGVWDKIRLRSVGWANMPERMGPITEEDETEIIASLVRELRYNYGVRVSEKLEGSR